MLTAKNSNRDSIFLSSPLPKPEPQSPSFTLYEGSSPKTPSIPITRETSDRQAKRKAYDMFETPPQVPVNNDVQVSARIRVSHHSATLLCSMRNLFLRNDSSSRAVYRERLFRLFM